MFSWRAFALIVLVAAVAPAQAGAAPREFFGVVPQRELTNKDFNRMEDGKVGTLRIGIHWPALQRSQGASDRIRDIFDDEFGRAAAAGMDVLPFINNSPAWVRDHEDLPPIRSAEDREAFKNFMRLLVKRYGPGGEYWTTEFRDDFRGATPRPVRTWQIWNEPSSPASWRPDPDPGDYAKLVFLAEEAVHAVDPSAQIMLAGVYHDPRHGAPSAPEFTRKLLQVDGLKSAIDGVAIHPYAENPEAVGEQIGAVRRVLEQQNAGDKELYITETGWSSANKKKGQSFTTLKGQAKKLKGVFRLAVQKKRAWNLGGIYWYSLVDLPRSEPACFFCHETGLFTANRRAKPAWLAFKSFTGG